MVDKKANPGVHYFKPQMKEEAIIDTQKKGVYNFINVAAVT